MSTVHDSKPKAPESPGTSSFAAEALKLSGKSEDEVRRMGAVDTADDRVEALFAARYQTVNSPIHKAIWTTSPVAEEFACDADLAEPSLAAAQVMDASLEVVRRHVRAGTLLDDSRKIRSEVMKELGTAGYWGLLIPAEYGGSGSSFSQFAAFLTKMATIDPTIAGLASVHGCIGAVDPLLTFGTAEQKLRLLPKLASGEKLSAFALTEPGAGSDLTALKTTAVLDGDSYVLNGEKLFITNVLPGRMIGVVCLIDNVPAVLIVELPETECEEFQLKRYGLYALKHAHNYGIVFRNLRVPIENRLDAGDGDGLTIAYHGLNRGRVALCANAAGTMRLMLADILPWARFRETYGEPIRNRELVQRRIGELAGLIVACDALTAWCAGLLDLGYRGEMECTIAKVYGSEAQKHAAIELHMKTHGGRSFLHGHRFGDNVHEFLAPCIYEGEGEMLSLAFFKSLVKQHGRQFFEPIGKGLQAAGITRPNLANPAHAWALRGPLWDYSKWWMGRRLSGTEKFSLPAMNSELLENARFAVKFLQDSAFEISATMRTHQLKLADRQCRMAELSSRVQTAVVMLCTVLHAAKQENPLVQQAAAIHATQLRTELLGQRPSDRFLRKITELGATLAEESFPGLAEVDAAEILMRY